VILLKLCVTIIIVSGLALIAEYGSPRLAGLLSGFPIGSAITLTFIGLENSPDFASQSALHNLAGMPAMLVFMLVFWLTSARWPDRAWYLAPLSAAGSFLAVAVLLHAVNFPALPAILLSAGLVVLFQRLFQRIPESAIDRRIHLGLGAVLFRALTAAGAVLAITGAARLVGPQWAGLLTSFPVTVFPLLIILTFTYGPGPGQAVVKHIPSGLWALMAYTLTLWLTAPKWGMLWSTLAGLSAALLLLGIALVFRGNRNAKRLGPPIHVGRR
jgi:hypothetical protein